MSPEAVLAALDSGAGGLGQGAVHGRRALFGRNEVSLRQVTARMILVRQLRSPYNFLLSFAVAVAFYAGQYVDALLVSSFIVLNVVLGFVQEYRAEQAAKLLRRYWRSRVRVVRGGKVAETESSDIVPGDIVRLRVGDRLPADIRLIFARGVCVDESAITGESAPVAKSSAAMSAAPTDRFEASNVCFAGTTFVSGEADGAVIATGRDSSLGMMVNLMGASGTTGIFEREVAKFSVLILRMVSVTMVVIFTLNMAVKGFGALEQTLLFAIALTIGVVPEALPVVMTVTHSRAAMKMAKRGVIVKRLSSIDDLGSVDVLCTDKTGTVTENRLRVAAVHSFDGYDAAFLALAGSSMLGFSGKEAANAFDLALWNGVDDEVRGAAEAYRNLAEIPFDPVSRRNAVLVEAPDGTRKLIMRGAAEAVFAACGRLSDQIGLGRLLEREGLAGRRVLAVAVKEMAATDGIEAHVGSGFSLAGLVAFEDPIKRGAISAVRRAAKLKVQVKMLTGDAREVAGAVAVQMGLIEDVGGVMTGAEFAALSAAEKLSAALERHVFARVSPEQKFEIMGLLQKQGKSVAFLGEGFNDVPGLRQADVALAVENAADVAKDSADVILTRKSLAAIIDGVEAGRRNFANVIKYLKITLASNIGNFYSVAVASLFVPFLPMLPVQILLLNLLTDAPMVAVAADEVNVEELGRPSRYDARAVIMAATLLGVVSSAFDFLTFGVFYRLGEGPLQTLWFMESALSELVLIFSVRTIGRFYRGPRIPRTMGLILGAVAVVCVALPFTSIGHSLFGFASPTPLQLASVLGIVAAYFLATEAVKLRLFRNGRNAHAGSAA